jgi:hypothetical protein
MLTLFATLFTIRFIQIQLRSHTLRIIISIMFGPASMNDNQNYRVIHSGRTSSRVLAPPGGHSSLTIGLPPPPPMKGEKYDVSGTRCWSSFVKSSNSLL